MNEAQKEWDEYRQEIPRELVHWGHRKNTTFRRHQRSMITIWQIWIKRSGWNG